MFRALHFSDVHVDLRPTEFPLGEMLNKRFVGVVNLMLRRRVRFVDSRAKLEVLARFARDQGADALLCTGDYTVLGTHPEYRAARAAIAPLLELRAPYVTVPGNHDLYLQDTVADGRFEAHFGDVLANDLPDLAGPDGWPRVRLLGQGAAAVCVNSARPNPQVWRSSGRVPEHQLALLSRVLDDPRVSGRFVFVLTHYAPRRPDGTPDTHLHGLENADALLSACRGRVDALLHGHIHRRFSVVADGVRVFGAGSATDRGREGLWMFELDESRRCAIPAVWQDGGYVLQREQAITL